MIEVIRTIIPVIVMLVIGIFCRQRDMISREGIGALKNVVVNITLPAVLLNAFATTSYRCGTERANRRYCHTCHTCGP